MLERAQESILQTLFEPTRMWRLNLPRTKSYEKKMLLVKWMSFVYWKVNDDGVGMVAMMDD